MIRGTYSCIAVGLTLASRQVGLTRYFERRGDDKVKWSLPSVGLRRFLELQFPKRSKALRTIAFVVPFIFDTVPLVYRVSHVKGDRKVKWWCSHSLSSQTFTVSDFLQHFCVQMFYKINKYIVFFYSSAQLVLGYTIAHTQRWWFLLLINDRYERLVLFALLVCAFLLFHFKAWHQWKKRGGGLYWKILIFFISWRFYFISLTLQRSWKLEENHRVGVADCDVFVVSVYIWRQ